MDQVAATQHDRWRADDYGRVRSIGIRTLREGLRWPMADVRGKLNLSELRTILNAANGMRLELILDLFHYGYPEDLDPFTEEFQDRFSDYCLAVAKTVSREADVPVYFTPVNEPSYFAWAAADAARFAPFQTGRSHELKRSLIGAAIQGIDAIWSVLPDARIVNVDPICSVSAPFGDDSRDQEVRAFNEGAVFECFDMLSGRLYPELGGSLRHLDLVGMNYYWTNQWELGNPEEPLDMDDPRLVPFSRLIERVWERYERPLVITETSHVDMMRGPWLRYVSEEVCQAISEGIPVYGICIYPILGMPEWHEPEVWTRMGLWNCVRDARGVLVRETDEGALREFHEASRRCPPIRRHVHRG